MSSDRERRIPEPTLGRVPRYLAALRGLRRGREGTVSSARLGREAGTEAALVRRDLSYFSCVGQPGVGYEIEELLGALQAALGPPGRRPLVLIGAGPLGAALAGYAGFEMAAYELVGIFDANPARVGHHLQGLPVRPMNELARVVVETEVRLGLLAVPAARAPEAAAQCAAAGLRGLLTFAPGHLQAPPGIQVRPVDVSGELAILDYQVRQSINDNR
jgi:redox-sensing transcriptional repressor